MCIHAQRKYVSRDSVTTIIIKDTARMAKIALQAKQEKEKIEKDIASKVKKPTVDSSRFIKRGQVVKTNNVLMPGNIKVDKAMYGTFTEYISDYVEKYQKNHGNRITAIKQRNRAYFAMIENTLKRNSMPKELKSLAVIESAMNPNAVSPVGAAGPWQFMEPTAKLLGLRVDETIDERRDMYKSTQAAARYMKQLYGMFHDWLLVIASYNCGPSPVLRAINSGAGRSFWDIKHRLPRETQNHVMAFIATSTYMDRGSNVLGMGNLPRDSKGPKPAVTTLKKGFLPGDKLLEKDKSSKDITKTSTPIVENIEEVADKEDEEDKPKIMPEEMGSIAILKVKGEYTLNVIAKFIDEDVLKLKRWNPTFDETIVNSPIAIQIRIPISKLEKFIIDKDKIVIASAKEIAARTPATVK
jgi:membrane-bound lytic murein transglycosylase D